MNIDALAAELSHARQSGADAILTKRDMGMSVAPHPLAYFANHLTEELAKNGLPQPIYLTDPQSLSARCLGLYPKTKEIGISVEDFRRPHLRLVSTR